MSVKDEQTKILEEEVALTDGETVGLEELEKEAKKAKVVELAKKVGKIAGIAAIGVIGFLLGSKSGNKSEYDDSNINEIEFEADAE